MVRLKLDEVIEAINNDFLPEKWMRADRRKNFERAVRLIREARKELRFAHSDPEKSRCSLQQLKRELKARQ